MKTFSEFIVEAKIKWNTGTLRGSGKSPSDTANQKLRQVSSSMVKAQPSKMVYIAQRIKRMKTAISSATEKSKVDDPRPETMDTRTKKLGTQRTNTGYATFRKDTPVSSVGTQSGQDRRIVNRRTGETISNTSLPPGMTVSGAHNNDPKRRNRPSRTGGTYGVKG